MLSKQNVLKKRESREKRLTTYAYQDTDSFRWGFNCVPQTLENADPVMIGNKFERMFEIRLTCEWD